jgi:hypothetical protein
MKEEAEDHHKRSQSKPGTIIGRPAGRDAYHGQSAMSYQKQSRDTTVENTQKP